MNLSKLSLSILQMLIEGQVTVYINLINTVMFFIIKMWFSEVQIKKDGH